jgi:hypothetical protein
MAYDAATGTGVLFDHGQTWTWDGTTWTQQQPASSPSPREYAAMAYDAATKTVVLFGGTAAGPLNDTWTWNGTTWTQQHPATSPPADIDVPMAYDAATGTAVLFGAGGHIGNGTWTWDGSNWTVQSPATSPQWFEVSTSMAYDASTSTVVLFASDGTTWTWDGTTWTQVAVVGDTVTVTSPGDQSAYRTTRLELQVQGSSSGGYPLTWSATGLPTGLTIGSSTGLISGRITATPSSYPVTVTASDTKASGQASFTWTILAPTGSPIINASSATCLNDYNGLVASGTPIIMWACISHGANEEFSHPSNPGELVVFGQCLTDPGSATGGARQVIQPCTGASDQIWNHTATSEYVLQATGQCLTDPGGSTSNGTQVEVRACHNVKDQHWNGS